MPRLPFTALALSSLFFACFPCCGDTTVGDDSQPLVVEPTVFRDGRYVVPEDGAEVPLVLGSQGGLMVLANVQARNLDTCGVNFLARLYSSDDRLVSETFSERNLVTDDDGHAQIDDPSGSVGLILFPCDDGMESGVGVRKRLEVIVTDRDGRTATATTHIVPVCPSGTEEWCRDYCAARNAPDAGTDAGP